jgi:fucose permease
LTNNTIHEHLGQRGIALLGPGLHVLAFVSAAQHPPYPVLVLACVLAGLGSGLIDAGWNAWIGAMPHSSGIMGTLHACYGLGAALSPLIATTAITKYHWEWYWFYYLMASAAAVELCTSAPAFWSATGAEYQITHRAADLGLHPAEGAQEEDNRSASTNTATARDVYHRQPNEGPRANPENSENHMVQALRKPSTWLISLFILLYAGIEISLADWIFTLLVDVRHHTPLAGSLVTFGYWGGVTLGRIVIGFLAPWIRRSLATEKGHVSVCLAMTIIIHAFFSLEDSLAASAIAAPLLGFFLGPLFPEAIVVQTKLVPKHLHITAVGFACALGSAGGCLFPFIVGAIAKARGMTILLPIVGIMLSLCLVLWAALPNPKPSPKRRTSGEPDGQC